MAENAATPPPSGGAGSGGPGDGGGKPVPRLGDLFWVGTACAVSVVAAGGIGYAIDDALGTLPWFTVGGLAFGVLCAVLLVVNQLRKYV